MFHLVTLCHPARTDALANDLSFVTLVSELRVAESAWFNSISLKVWLIQLAIESIFGEQYE